MREFISKICDESAVKTSCSALNVDWGHLCVTLDDEYHFADVHLYFFSDSISTKGPTVFKNSARSCGCAALYVGDFFSVSSSNDLCATDC